MSDKDEIVKAVGKALAEEFYSQFDVYPLIKAAQRVCDERLLVHQIPDPKISTEHASDCPACELRAALQTLELTMRQRSS